MQINLIFALFNHTKTKVMTNFLPVRSILLVCLSLVLLSSCKNDEVAVKDFAYIRFINASPTLATYNIYFDDKMVNTAAIPFGGTISYTPYVLGAHTLKYTAGSNINPILTKSITLSDKINSAYLIGKDNSLEVLLVADDASVTSTTKAFVKFINLSPDAPALSLDIKGGANLAKDKSYKLGSGFVQVDPKSYDLEIKDPSGNVKTTLTGVDMVAGRYYTVISKGMLNPSPTEQAFSAQSIINL